MSEESTTPDLAECVRIIFEAADREDFDAALDFYVPHAIWRGTVDDAEGVPAIRELWVSYFSAFEELRLILDDVVDLRQRGHPRGSPACGPPGWRRRSQRK